MKGLLPLAKTKTIVDPDLLLPCVLDSGVPVRNIKTITAQLEDTTMSDWESFRIMTRGGAVIQEIQTGGTVLSSAEEIKYGHRFVADYSPTILEMIQEGKLLNLR